MSYEATGREVGGGGGGQVIGGLTGWSTSDYYEGPAGQLQGSATHTLVALVRHRSLLTVGDPFICGTWSRFAGPGYGLYINSVRPGFLTTRADGATVNTAGAGNGWPTASPIPSGVGRYALYHQTYDGTTIRGYLMGTLVRALAAGGGGGYQANIYPLVVGGTRNNAGGIAPVPWDGAICGLGISESVAFTQDQVIDHTLQTLEAGALQDGGGGLEHLWSLTAPDATIADQIGAAPLTRVGSLTAESRNLIWI